MQYVGEVQVYIRKATPWNMGENNGYHIMSVLIILLNTMGGRAIGEGGGERFISLLVYVNS